MRQINNLLENILTIKLTLFFIGSEKFKYWKARIGAKKSKVAATWAVLGHCYIPLAKTFPCEDNEVEGDNIHKVGLFRLKSCSDDLPGH